MADAQAPTQEIGTELTTLLIKAFNRPNVPGWNMYLDDIETVPELAWPNSVRTFEIMRTDAQIAGLMSGLTLPIRRYKWMIDPGEASEEAVAKLADDLALPVMGDESAHSVASITRRFNHDAFLRQALLALVYGFMPFEIIGDIVDGWWRLRKLSPRVPRTVMSFNMDYTGTLLGIRQLNMPMQEVIPAENLVLFTWDKEGAHHSGRSVLRPMYRHWLIKDRLLRIDAMKHERNGMGVPIATASPNASDNEIKLLNQMAQQLKVGDASGGAVPYGSKMDLVGTSGSIPDTIGSIRYHDESMARSMLMMFMQLGSGTTSGNRALGESFIDWFSLSQDAVAGWYAETLQEHFIENWIRWNIGEGEPAPRLVYKRASNQLAIADLVGLIGAGAIHVDPTLEAHLRDEFNYPETDVEAAKEATTPTGGPAEKIPVTEPTPPTTSLGTPPAGNTIAGPEIASKRRWVPRWMQRTIHAGTLPTVKPDRSMQARLPARQLRRNPYQHEVAAQTDFSRMESHWTSGVDQLVAAWGAVQTKQLDALHAGIVAAKGDLVKLAAISGKPDAGVGVLKQHMTTYAKAAATDAHTEAAKQGITLPVVKEDVYAAKVNARAEAMSALMNKNLSEAAGRKAVQLTGGKITPTEVAGSVRDYIAGFSESFVKDQLGAALTASQNDARVAQLEDGNQPGRWYASELLDANTCTPCSQVDGTEYTSAEEALSDYPAGGYADCEGGPRCRGTVVMVFDEAGANA